MTTTVALAPTAQLMFNAETTMAVPSVPLTVLAVGFTRENTVELEQVSAPYAFSRFPVIVVPAIAPVLSPPAKMRLRIARQSRPGSWAFNNAATPATWGVAIDVPLKTE